MSSEMMRFCVCGDFDVRIYYIYHITTVKLYKSYLHHCFTSLPTDEPLLASCHPLIV
jgi:hypothetical protein